MKTEASVKFPLISQFSFFKYTQNIIQKTYVSLYFFLFSSKDVWATKFHIAQLCASNDSASCSLEEGNPHKN